MPRKHPLPDAELQVACRLKEARRFKQCTRRYLANVVGTDPEEVKRVEVGRVALAYELAARITSALGLNPWWLANGKGRMLLDVPLPRAHELGISTNAGFLTVFNERFAAIDPSDEGAESDLGMMAGEGNRRAGLMDFLSQCVTGWADEVPTDKLSGLCADVQNYIADAVKNYPRDTEESILRRKAARAVVKLGAEKHGGKQSLTKLIANGNSADVKQIWDAFLKRLNEATAVHGMKSQLAKFMGVPLPNVSQWLSGDREPSGANTLRLLQWVERQERQQTKSPGSADTPPGPKARSTPSGHEKVKSSPRKP